MFNLIKFLKEKIAYIYLVKGSREFNNNNFELAIKYFDKVIKLVPNNCGLYNCRGNAYAYIGNNEEAIKNYTKAIELDSNYSHSYLLRADAITNLGNYNDALNDINIAISLAPSDIPSEELAKYYYTRANAFDWLGKTKEALPDINKAIELLSNNSTFYHKRAVTKFGLFALKEAPQDILQEALQDINTAIMLDSNIAEYFIVRARIYNELERFEDAINDCNIGLELNSDEFYLYGLRGSANFGLFKYSEAIQDFNVALELEPNEELMNYYLRAFAKEELDDIDGAIEDLKTFIELCPTEIYAYINLAHMFYDKNNCKDGLFCLNKALEVNPNSVKIYQLKAWFNAKLGDEENAIADLNKAIEIDPNDGNNYIGFALVYSMSKKFQEALEYINKGISMLNEPEYTVFSNRGGIQIELGNFEAGLADFEKMLNSKRLLNSDIRNIIQRDKYFDELLTACNKVLEENPDNDNAQRLKQAILEHNHVG